MLFGLCEINFRAIGTIWIVLKSQTRAMSTIWSVLFSQSELCVPLVLFSTEEYVRYTVHIITYEAVAYSVT